MPRIHQSRGSSYDAKQSGSYFENHRGVCMPTVKRYFITNGCSRQMLELPKMEKNIDGIHVPFDLQSGAADQGKGRRFIKTRLK